MSENNKLTHLLDIESLSIDTTKAILSRSQSIISQNFKSNITFPNKRLINLFFEHSTRTKCSFEIAAQNLKMNIVNFDVNMGSIHKGESLQDTIQSLEAMQTDIFVIRHSEDSIHQKLADCTLQSTHIINAGGGKTSHPSQALLDMLTISQYKDEFEDLTVAIIGDIRHSRVANSDIQALLKLKTKEIRLIGPKSFLPTTVSHANISLHNSLKEGLKNVDVIICLRIQKERHVNANLPSEHAFHQSWGLNSETVKYAKPDAIIMHPGPINRDVEISASLADSPQAVILQQVTNGIAVRMAIIQELLT